MLKFVTVGFKVSDVDFELKDGLEYSSVAKQIFDSYPTDSSILESSFNVYKGENATYLVYQGICEFNSSLTSDKAAEAKMKEFKSSVIASVKEFLDNKDIIYKLS